MDQKTYDFIKQKLPWTSENMEDFVAHAVSLRFEHYLMIISQTISQLFDMGKIESILIEGKNINVSA